MKAHFYSHIIDLGPLHVELAKLELTEIQKKELEEIAQGTIHHTILDTLLSELSEEDKKTFLLQVDKEDVKEIWDLLSSKVQHAEEKIKKRAEKTLLELISDIHALKQ